MGKIENNRERDLLVHSWASLEVLTRLGVGVEDLCYKGRDQQEATD